MNVQVPKVTNQVLFNAETTSASPGSTEDSSPQVNTVSPDERSEVKAKLEAILSVNTGWYVSPASSSSLVALIHIKRAVTPSNAKSPNAQIRYLAYYAITTRTSVLPERNFSCANSIALLGFDINYPTDDWQTFAFPNFKIGCDSPESTVTLPVQVILPT